MKTMKLLLTTVAALGLTGLTANIQAEEEAKTIKGTAMCAKCELAETEKCKNVLQVMDADGKKTNYYFTKNIDHKLFCKGTKPDVEAVGIVEEKDGKMIIAATEVKAS